MNIVKLRTIKSFYFTVRDVATALEVSEASARVSCCRYVRQGILTRLMRDVYVLSGRWELARDHEVFMLANRLQVPSYVSLTSALVFYGATMQVQQGFVESIAIKRTKKIETHPWRFEYMKIAKKLYFGFTRKNHFFIARPEKALLDALYMMTLGIYRLDVSSVDKAKFNVKILKKFSKHFPEPTQKALNTLWRI